MEQSHKNVYAVIMAGGIGSRFWPISTQKYPKQFQDILGVGKSMIRQTYERLLPLIPSERIFVVTANEYLPLCAEHLPELPLENIIGEPSSRNTAACNLYIAHLLASRDSEAVLVVLPSDHLILKENLFVEKLQAGISFVEKENCLLTLGITPTRPDTGYGYIQYNTLNKPESNNEFFKVKTFTEKPNLDLAQSFIESGDFLWNAGIFLWTARAIIHAFEKYQPDMAEQFLECKIPEEKDEASRYNFPENCIVDIYPKLQKISVDHAILEKAENVFVLPADLGWSDLGTWTSIYENAEKNDQGNVCYPKNMVLGEGCTNSILRTTQAQKLIIADGLQDYIVIDTEKVLLILPKEKDQTIKDIVLKVKQLRRGDQYI